MRETKKGINNGDYAGGVTPFRLNEEIKLYEGTDGQTLNNWFLSVVGADYLELCTASLEENYTSADEITFKSYRNQRLVDTVVVEAPDCAVNGVGVVGIPLNIANCDTVVATGTISETTKSVKLFVSKESGLQFNGVPEHAIEITPSDTDNLDHPVNSFRVGAGGDVKIVTIAGETVTIKEMADGEEWIGRVAKIFDTDTTASDIIGKY